MIDDSDAVVGGAGEQGPTGDSQAPPTLSLATTRPLHVACIMDGNGRWATRRGMSRIDGHAAGETAIIAAIDASLHYKIKWLTLFAFSTENWQRPPDEVAFLMKFNAGIIDRHGDYFHSSGIRVRYLGRDDERIPRDLTVRMRAIEERTARNTVMTLSLAFNYGGKAELNDLVRSIVSSGIAPTDITDEVILEHTQFPDLPDVDLLIRTGDEHRLSNFLPLKLSYTELYFIEDLWPDFSDATLANALLIYGSRRRRFGAIPQEE